MSITASTARSRVGGFADRYDARPTVDDLSERPTPIALPPVARIESASPLTLAEAYRSYIDDPTRAWTANTREAYETSRRLAIAVIGEATPIASVSRTHCRNLLDVLRFLPANAGKLFPKLSPREAAERARLYGDIRIISAANANSLMSNMSSFLNWAVNEELLARNPARGCVCLIRSASATSACRSTASSFMRFSTHRFIEAASMGSAATNKVGNHRLNRAGFAGGSNS